MVNQVTISTTISAELLNLLKEHHIERAEALRVGASMLLAEKGIQQYDNKLNLYRKMQAYKSLTEELSQKLGEIDVLDKKINNPIN